MFEIINRLKHSKLTFDQLIFLKQLIIRNENRISTINRIYQMVPST